jgi:hypothetical protein
VAARVIALVALFGCGRQRDLPPMVELAASPEAPRLVLIGDTGAYRAGDADPAACDPNEDRLDVSEACRARMIELMRAEASDGILALGDLVYFSGPTCPRSGLTDAAGARLDDVLGDYLGAVGAPVLVALGNHDVHQSRWGAAGAERCYLDYAQRRDGFVFPERTYTATVGDVLVGVLDTNRRLSRPVADALDARIAAHRAAFPEGWVLFAGHHPVRTYRDNAVFKALVGKWIRRYGWDVDLYANGHAHYLQFGVYDGVPAVTSGSGAKAYRVAECRDGDGACGPGERFTRATWGYATATFDERLTVVFRDVAGQELFTWSRDHGDPEGVGVAAPAASR